jgi:hypothetical protein
MTTDRLPTDRKRLGGLAEAVEERQVPTSLLVDLLSKPTF